MHGNRRAAPGLLLLGISLVLGGCAFPTSRENVDQTARLVAAQLPVALEWRRDPAADAAARSRAEALLEGGLTLQEAIAVAFLASPELQLALEQLEISRADFVRAVTPPNPVLVLGSRKPGGDIAAFYPDRSVSFGVLQNVISLLDMPDRRAIAKRDLQRARFEAARRATAHAAAVAEAWIDYRAALQLRELRERYTAVVRVAYDNLAAASGEEGASVLELANQREAVLGAEGSVLRAVLNERTARIRLGEQLGIAGWREDWRLDGELSAPSGAEPEPATLEAVALDRRLDLRALASEIQARLRVLAMQRRFRWLNQLEVGVFRDSALGGTSFTGPNAIIELALFDQRQAKLLESDAELRTAMRQLEAARLAARGQIRTHAAQVEAARRLYDQLEQQVLPNQRQMQAALGAGDPDDPQRLRLRLLAIGAEEDQAALLRDYWRARSQLALAGGDWAGLSGL